MTGECLHAHTTEYRNGDHVVVTCDDCGAWLRSYHV